MASILDDFPPLDEQALTRLFLPRMVSLVERGKCPPEDVAADMVRAIAALPGSGLALLYFTPKYFEHSDNPAHEWGGGENDERIVIRASRWAEPSYAVMGYKPETQNFMLTAHESYHAMLEGLKFDAKHVDRLYEEVMEELERQGKPRPPLTLGDKRFAIQRASEIYDNADQYTLGVPQKLQELIERTRHAVRDADGASPAQGFLAEALNPDFVKYRYYEQEHGPRSLSIEMACHAWAVLHAYDVPEEAEALARCLRGFGAGYAKMQVDRLQPEPARNEGTISRLAFAEGMAAWIHPKKGILQGCECDDPGALLDVFERAGVLHGRVDVDFQMEGDRYGVDLPQGCRAFKISEDKCMVRINEQPQRMADAFRHCVYETGLTPQLAPAERVHAQPYEVLCPGITTLFGEEDKTHWVDRSSQAQSGSSSRGRGGSDPIKDGL